MPFLIKVVYSLVTKCQWFYKKQQTFWISGMTLETMIKFKKSYYVEFNLSTNIWDWPAYTLSPS